MIPFFYPKLYSLLKEGIEKKQVVKDIFSGLVVGIISIPLAIAFAVACGVSPEKGLITSVVAGFLISLLGGSRIQIGGPTGAFIVVVFGIVNQYGINGLMISTILAGFLLVGFGLLRLGALLKYFPHPLVVGFTSGIALIIFSTQVKDALGLDLESVPSEFIFKWLTYFENLNSINLFAVGITLTTMLISTQFKRINDKVPGSFVAIISITFFTHYFALPVTTIETFFGEISNNFSFALPSLNFRELPHYFAPALTIALLGGIESLLSAVVSDGMIGGKHRSNTELIAQGIANIITPLFGGIPATGAIARTATNAKNGGRTPISGIVHSLTILLVMLFFGYWAKLIPMACLAGILIVVSYNMSEWRSFRSILNGSVYDIIILLNTFLLTVLVDLSVAIQVGVVLSALLFMKRMSDLGNKIPPELDGDLIENYDSIPKEIGIFEISGPLFFASAREYAEIINQIGLSSSILIIRLRHVPFMDITGAHNLKATLFELKKRGVVVILSGVKPRLYLDLRNNGISQLIEKKYIFDLFDNAIQAALDVHKVLFPPKKLL
jgi:sulfate permease, SulP family